MDAALSTSLVILDEAKAFAQSLKQAEKLREELQAEVLSTKSMLDKLQDLVKEIGNVDANGVSATAVPAGSPSGGIQSLLKLDDINDEVMSLQSTVENIRTQLESINNWTDKKKLRERLGQMLRPEKRKDDVQALLTSLRSIHTSASWLTQRIPIRLLDLQRREQIDWEAKRLLREEEARHEEAERRRQEAEKQELKQSEKQRQELIDWLKPFDYNSKHQTATQLRQEGTCGWILENETFHEWRSGSGSNFLWLCGIPGSGKTILCSKVIDHLENLADTTVVYHYCDFVNTDSIIPSTILRSIFVQLLRRSNRNWLDEFKDLSLSKKEGKSPPSGLKDLVDLIQKASRLHQRTIIALDALDECQANPDRRKLLQLLHPVQIDNMSVFVTSRDESDFHTAFRDLPSISLDNVKTSVESDIRMTISRELKEHPRFSNSPDEERDEITRVIVKRAEGMFQLVRCLIDVIDNCFSKSAIATLETFLPKGLNETYERLLKNIDLKEQSLLRPAGLARRILMWLVGANRPLHILELYEAVMIEPNNNQLNDDFRMIDPSDLLVACGSLVQSFTGSSSFDIDEAHFIENVLDQNVCDKLFPNQGVFQNHRTTYVRLSHYTVKEFLQTAPLEDARLSAYRLPPTVANHDVAVLILTYLTLDVFDHLEISSWDSDDLSYRFRYYDNVCGNLSKFITRFKVGMLFSYGWTNWESHLLHSMNSESLYELLQRFFEKRLGQLCCDGRILREMNFTVDVDNKYIYVLLLFAISNGIRWLTQLLLDDSPISDHLNPCNSRNPRIMSTKEDETNAVEVLIQAGAYLNTLSWHGSALSAAASGGYLELLWVLIQAGADPNAVGWGGRTALHDAASRGDLEVSTMLIQAGVDPNVVDRHGRTALHDSVSGGHSEVSTTLIQASIDPNAVDRDRRTALHNAAFGGHFELSTMLIQAGANPNAVDEGGETVLHVAASRGDLEVSTMLIQAGVDPNAIDESGRTALHNAASGGHLQVSTKMIQAGANPNAVDAEGRTALHDAASRGDLEVLTMLIQAGADPNVVDPGGRTALHDAASRGHLKVLTILIQAGADPNVVDQGGRTALHDAASGGDLEVSTILIRAGADPNVVDQGGRTALHDAASRGHLKVLTTLIQASADPNAVSEDGGTALHNAASGGHLEVSTILIQASVDPDAVDRSGRTALHDAASGGHLEISTMLIQAGVDPNAVDEKGRTVLHDAASGGHLQVSKVLIQAGADPLSKNKSGKTPLHIAIDLHSKSIVECLLSNGAPLTDLGLLYDEQVQWAQELPWYSQLGLREFDYSAPVDEEVDVIPPRSVLELRWMLHEIFRLPSEVVGLILDLSEYWAHSFVWRKDQIVTHADVSYLCVKLRSKGSGSLRKVVFTTKSHEETKYSNPYKEPVYDRYHSRFEVIVTSPTSIPSLEPRLIQRNVSNSPISRIHVNTWDYEDHANWMDEIYPEDVISVHAEGGWYEKNVVDFVRMDIYCAW